MQNRAAHRILHSQWEHSGWWIATPLITIPDDTQGLPQPIGDKARAKNKSGHTEKGLIIFLRWLEKCHLEALLFRIFSLPSFLPSVSHFFPLIIFFPSSKCPSESGASIPHWSIMSFLTQCCDQQQEAVPIPGDYGSVWEQAAAQLNQGQLTETNTISCCSTKT